MLYFALVVFHIFQGDFTGTGAILDCPSASEVTLKDKGKIKTDTKQQQIWSESYA